MPTSINCIYFNGHTYSCANACVKRTLWGFGPRSCIEVVHPLLNCAVRKSWPRPEIIASDTAPVIPILSDHGTQEQIGEVRMINGKLRVKFYRPLPREDAFKILGNAGLLLNEITEFDGKTCISECEIIYFGLGG